MLTLLGKLAQDKVDLANKHLAFQTNTVIQIMFAKTVLRDALPAQTGPPALLV